jgi:threonine dehydrogenase-like Zn-dependent dehydrogenase
MNGRVAVLKAYGGDFELREYPVADPEPGAILVRLTRAGVCGSDLHIWRGEMKEIYGALPRDLTFGHEMCGRVHRLGAGVTADSAGQPLAEGDRVAFLYFFPCGRCPVCLRDEMGCCPRKARANRVAGTPPYFNNAYGDYYHLRPGGFVFRVPEEVTDDVATPANCALAQVIYGLTRAGLRQGDTVVVQGAGGLGLNAVAVARDMGADRVIVFDRVESRLALARAFGADHTLSLAELTTPERRIQAVMDLTGGFGADVVADFVGYPEVVPEGLRMLRGGGCYLEVGSIAPGNVFSYDATALVRGNARLVATSNYSPWALARALAFLRRNVRTLPFDRLVSHVFPLERISEAFQQADWMQRGGDGLRISRAALSMD